MDKVKYIIMEGLADVDWDLLSSYAGLLGLATFSIYAGAYASLPVCQTMFCLIDTFGLMVSCLFPLSQIQGLGRRTATMKTRRSWSACRLTMHGSSPL